MDNPETQATMDKEREHTRKNTQHTQLIGRVSRTPS